MRPGVASLLGELVARVRQIIDRDTRIAKSFGSIEHVRQTARRECDRYIDALMLCSPGIF